ncbi:alpha/beta fold hydrolase [Deinococcus sp. Leaf326]|uniref:alpha/beta fold hydrolase n=1 Tax=Deinococcus sp. Leaf326 TaxID=1736338 RepID=UPI0006F967F1|nr:alpha/beta hydrolase [Deinococcus sp. Leaf326]KQR36251.1 beta-ketoadipate enol-lactone hydrolase [Deinococcus sp. Leaf326]
MPPARTALLLHAYPLSAAMWDEPRRALEAAGWTVLAPNLPGFGGQPGAVTSLRGAAADFLALLPPEPLALVGLSMGGYLGLELLAQAPERFFAAVLADTTARADPPEKVEARHEQAGRALAEGTGFLVDAAREEHRPSTFGRIRPMVEAATPAGVAGALRAMAARPDHRDTLRGLKMPVLTLVGAEDTLTPPERAQEMAELAGGRREVLPGAAHLSNLDAPKTFTAALLPFLEEALSAASGTAPDSAVPGRPS